MKLSYWHLLHLWTGRNRFFAVTPFRHSCYNVLKKNNIYFRKHLRMSCGCATKMNIKGAIRLPVVIYAGILSVVAILFTNFKLLIFCRYLWWWFKFSLSLLLSQQLNKKEAMPSHMPSASVCNTWCMNKNSTHIRYHLRLFLTQHAVRSVYECFSAR